MSAHQLESDAGISAVLHVPPDDNPIAGRDSLLAFEFSSDQPDFDLGYCKCVVSFQAADGRQQTAAVEQQGSSTRSGQSDVRFDKAGVYDVYVRGQTGQNPGPRFALHYILRVTAGTNPDRSQAGLQVAALGITALVLISLIAASQIRRGKRYHPKI